LMAASTVTREDADRSAHDPAGSSAIDMPARR
jgi:hypothetical protein